MKRTTFETTMAGGTRVDVGLATFEEAVAAAQGTANRQQVRTYVWERTGDDLRYRMVLQPGPAPDTTTTLRADMRTACCGARETTYRRPPKEGQRPQTS